MNACYQYCRKKRHNNRKQKQIPKILFFYFLVPPMGKTENIKAEGSGSFQLSFEWSQEVFSDIMGSLVNYAIIIGLPEAVGIYLIFLQKCPL